MKDIDKHATEFKVAMGPFTARYGYKGVCAVISGDDRANEVALVAPTVEALELLWDKVNPTPLDRTRLQSVIIIPAPPK